jgi:hypothetical protein
MTARLMRQERPKIPAQMAGETSVSPEPFRSHPGNEPSGWCHVWPLLVFLTVVAALVALIIVAVTYVLTR